MMRWWWFGPAVTKAEIAREIAVMKAGGIGGFEIQPLYPLTLDSPSLRNLPFLSDEFIDALKFAGEEGARQGMRVDLTLGTGWPYGGPSVPVQEAAGRLRVEKIQIPAGAAGVPLPSLEAGETIAAAFVLNNTSSKWEPARTSRVELESGAAQDARQALVFINSRSGMMVKRPAVNGEGFVVDHYDAQATRHYLASVADRLMQGFPQKAPYAVFCDSLEVFSSDWTADFLTEFQKRRGYDLTPLLPALVDDRIPNARAIRHDWGKTLSELVEDRFLAEMQSWAKQHGTQFRVQSYGIPPATVSSYLKADLNEGEGFQWRVVRASRWAASASHLMGRPVTSSETWTWLHSPVFRATPLDIKAEADLQFLQGINQFIGHGWPYSPPEAEYPGWRMYAAAVFNDQNPWWPVMPDVMAYLQRTSYLMRQGRPANDVLLYLPNDDAWADFTPGKVHLIDQLKEMVGSELIGRVLDAGYNLDFVDDVLLKRAGTPRQGAFEFAGSAYPVVILPNVESMPLSTLERLSDFVKQGGTLIATERSPAKLPGYRVEPAQQKRFEALAAELFTGPHAKAVVVQGIATELARALHDKLAPDVAMAPGTPQTGFVHRSLGDSELYFIANTTNQEFDADVAFRTSNAHAELWDPLHGSVARIATSATSPHQQKLKLHFEPYASRVVVFRKQPSTAAPAMAPSPAGPSVLVDTKWTIRFPKGAAQTTSPLPYDWSQSAETRGYSGTAVYSSSLQIQSEWLGSGKRVLLDFGAGTATAEKEAKNGFRVFYDPPIREAAVIRINGKRAGSLWAPPYQMDITEIIHAGANSIEIEVGNTAMNWMATHPQPSYRLLQLKYGNRFQPQDLELISILPSGLLQPLRLRLQNESPRQ